MEKKIVHFIIITVLFIVGYTYFISKFYPPSPSATPSAAKYLPTAPLSGQQIKVTQNPALPLPTKDIVQTVETDKFIVTYSLTGGYIKKIHAKIYNEDLIFNHIGFIPKLAHETFSLSSSQNNKVVLESADHQVKEIWQFDGYHIILTLILPQQNTTMDLFHNSLQSNGLNRRYQEDRKSVV